MISFWKKTGQKEKNTSPNDISNHNGNSVKNEYDFETSKGPLASFSDVNLDDIDNDNVNFSTTSRLSKTLSEVLLDKKALAYFIQYMEIRGALSFVKFWIDAESFRSAALLTTINKIHIDYDELENVNCRKKCPSISHDSLSVSTDDSCTPDSTSLFEDSQINLSEQSQTLTDFKCTNHFLSNDSILNGVQVKKYEELNKTNDLVDNINYEDCVNNEIKHLDVPNNVANICDKNSISSHKCEIVKNQQRKSTSISDDSSSGCVRIAIELSTAITDDAIKIFKKYVSSNAPHSVRCTEEIRNEIIETLCNSNEMFNAHCFDKLQLYVFQIMDREYFSDFLRSDYHCKHRIDVLTSGNVLLSDILYNETALFYFMEFLQQENSHCLLEFWLTAINFQKNLQNNGISDSNEVQNDAMILYDRYFSLQATQPLGFSDKIRFEIEQNICHENGPQINSFSKPIRIIEIILEKHHLSPFLSSQLFFNYLSELINSIQSNTYNILPGRHRRVGSDCSSEISGISMQMTSDQTSMFQSRSKRSSTNMSIDTKQIYDPDSLWQRQKSGLALGRVTELGRFETAIEPQPDRKSESKISKVMKKLVNMEEDKSKEEMAWQIAEMIVKDITSLTLSQSAPD